MECGEAVRHYRLREVDGGNESDARMHMLWPGWSRREMGTMYLSEKGEKSDDTRMEID